MASGRTFFLTLLFVVASSLATVSPSENGKCKYVTLIKTGDLYNGGTDATITLKLYDKNNNEVVLHDLTRWGGDRYTDAFFERDCLDGFRATGENCLAGPPCRLKLISDGKGIRPGWNVEYVHVTMVRSDHSCSVVHYPINNWLVDEPEYGASLTLEKNLCNTVKAPNNATAGPDVALSSIV